MVGPTPEGNSMEISRSKLHREKKSNTGSQAGKPKFLRDWKEPHKKQTTETQRRGEQMAPSHNVGFSAHNNRLPRSRNLRDPNNYH